MYKKMVDLSRKTEIDREITAFFWNYQIFSEKNRFLFGLLYLAVQNAGLLNVFSGV